MPTIAIDTTQLRKHRKARGLTQVQLAEGTGIRQGTISDWESGNVRRIDLTTLDKFCAVLGVGTGDLLQRKRGRKSKAETRMRALLRADELRVERAMSVQPDVLRRMSVKRRATRERIVRCNVAAAECMRVAVAAAERGDSWEFGIQAHGAGFYEGLALGKLELFPRYVLTKKSGAKGGRPPNTKPLAGKHWQREIERRTR